MDRLTPQTTPFNGRALSPEVELTSTVSVPVLRGKMTCLLSYQPDHAVVSAEAFQHWLNDAAKSAPTTWEELAAYMLDGFYDTALPKVVSLRLTIAEQDHIQHTISLRKTQPAS